MSSTTTPNAAAPAPRVKHVPKPIDPDTPEGREAIRGLSELAYDIAERLRAEGKPVPDYLL